MGTDIYHESGIVCLTEDFMTFVNSRTKEDVFVVCLNFYSDLENKCESEDVLEHFSSLHFEKIPTIHELRDALTDVIKVNGAELINRKYNLETYVEYSDHLLSLFREIVKVYERETERELPELKEITAFGCTRYNGVEVPLGEACFIFDDEPCYVKKITEVGKNLERVIGTAEVSQWTEYSC